MEALSWSRPPPRARSNENCEARCRENRVVDVFEAATAQIHGVKNVLSEIAPGFPRAVEDMQVVAVAKQVKQVPGVKVE